jgi:hypothetical protein
LVGEIFWSDGVFGMFVYVWYMQRFIFAYAKYYYAICLKKDILYMCKTEIQNKKDIKNGGKSHEKSIYHKLVSAKIVFPTRC